MQERNSHIGADCVFARDSRQSAALATDCNVERFVTLRSQFVESDVFADVHAGLEFNAEFTENIDFRFDDVFFKFVGRNTVGEHTAEFFVLFKHGGFVTLGCEIVCARKSCRACADDCDLLAPLFVNVGRNDHFGNVSGLCVQILFCNEFLDVVDCDCFVNSSARAGCFATLVADATADCRERVVLLDESKSFSVFAFFCFADITLNSNVCGASNLARRRTCLVAVDTVVVAIIFVPFIRTPTEIVGKFVLRILDFALLGAKLLSEFDCACGAIFDAFAASHAFVFFNLCDVCASGHIRSVEKL